MTRSVIARTAPTLVAVGLGVAALLAPTAQASTAPASGAREPVVRIESLPASYFAR